MFKIFKSTFTKMLLLGLALFNFSSFFVFRSENQSQNISITTNNMKKERNKEDIDLFKHYEESKRRLEEENYLSTFTFDDFQRGFSNHNYSIDAYKEYFIDYSKKISNLNLAFNYSEVEVFSSGSGSSSSSSGTANYILDISGGTEKNPEKTPKSFFKKIPDYSTTSAFDLSLIREGDIIYETNTLLNIGHVGVVVDVDHDSEYGSYIQTIEAVNPKVSYGYLDKWRMEEYGVKILRPFNIPTSKVDDVIYFLEQQIDVSYNLDILRLNTSINSDSCYCSELCYAAYKYAGLDIGMRYKKNGLKISLTLGCLPIDIYNGYYHYEKCLLNRYYLDIKILYGDSWRIQVFNNTNQTMKLSYNKKMCFLSDGANWTNLSDVVGVALESPLSIIITISPNWFADAIAISNIKSSKRYITYANQIDDKLLSANVRYNKVSING